MKVVFLGATRGMGRALARLMAARGDTLYLLGRDLQELDKSAADLRARSDAGVAGVGVCDLNDLNTIEPALASADEALGGFDCAVVTAGAFGTQEQLEADLERAAGLLHVNFTATIAFCERARQRMMSRGGGKLCVFSSVAGDRGRKPVGIYGASKAGLSAYLEALDHRYHDQGLQTICVKPGFVKTGMTAGLKPPPFAGEAEPVARRVLAAVDKGTPVVYAPWIWRWVILVIRLLPRFVMRRVGF